VASTIASGVKMMPSKVRANANGHQWPERPCQVSDVGSGHSKFVAQAPKMPPRPNSSTKMRPAITGEIENGRSIKVINSTRPLKRNLVIAQAAANPKRMLSGTTIAATMQLKRIELQVRSTRPRSAESFIRSYMVGLASGFGAGA
jgi:hypothetical protein